MTNDPNQRPTASNAAWAWASALLAITLAIGGYHAIAQASLAFADPPQRFFRENGAESSTPVLTRSLGAAASYRWGSIEVFHVRADSDADAGFRRGKDIRALSGNGIDATLQGCFDALKKAQAGERWRAVEELFSRSLAGSPPQLPSSWPASVLRETQGLCANGPKQLAGSLQRMLVASDVDGFIEGEGLAVHGSRGPTLLLIYRCAVCDIGTIARPLVVHHEQRTAFMLSLFGTSIPIAGINSNGVALARFAPGWDPAAYQIAIGPDAAAQAHHFLLRYRSAGLDKGGIGEQLLLLSEPAGSEQLISRLASPGILLAAGPGSAWRYEWNAGGGDEPRAVEFAALDTGAASLPAASRFLHPELAPKGSPPSSEDIARRFECSGTDQWTFERMERFVRQCDTGEIRLALMPAERTAIIGKSGGSAAVIPLPLAARQKW